MCTITALLDWTKGADKSLDRLSHTNCPSSEPRTLAGFRTSRALLVRVIRICSNLGMNFAAEQAELLLS